MNTPETRLCAHHLTGMSYRDVDLVEDLIGKKTCLLYTSRCV